MRLKRLFSPVLCLVLVTVIFVSMAIPGLAFNYQGIHWNANLVYYNDSSLPLEWRNQITLAAWSWNGAGADFDLYYSPASNNTWTAADMGQYGVALTYKQMIPPGNILYRCYTIFNTYYSFSTTGGGGTYDIQTVALHEFGHWLHLGHMYSGTNIVMYYRYTGVKRILD